MTECNVKMMLVVLNPEIILTNSHCLFHIIHSVVQSFIYLTHVALCLLEV